MNAKFHEPATQDPDPAPGGGSVRATVEALFRHRAAFLGTVAVVLALTVLITLLTPKRTSPKWTSWCGTRGRTT